MSDSNRNHATSSAAAGEASSIAGLWDVAPVMEMQARLWNQMLDAQRDLWAMYMPWLKATPWLGDTQAIDQEEEGKEPATTADGIPDALELQARTWSHFLDANRQIWSAFTTPMEAALATMKEASDTLLSSAGGAVEQASDASAEEAHEAAEQADEQEAETHRHTSASRKKAAGSAKRRSGHS